MTPPKSRRWLITGVSTGLGAALAAEVLARGDLVFGLVRSPDDAKMFAAQSDGAIALVGDITDHQQIALILSAAKKQFGIFDIVVNNAGFGLMGAIEEVSLAEMRAQFEVNFFGCLSIIHGVLPGMRERGSGHIINITSVSGLAPWAGTGAYTASKFALEGLGQTLHEELAELGIHVTNVAPGGLRTNFGSSSLHRAKKVIADYEGAGHLPQRVYRETTGKEPGDPRLAAKAIYDLSLMPQPPMHFLLGADALKYFSEAQKRFNDEIEAHRAYTLGIGCADDV